MHTDRQRVKQGPSLEQKRWVRYTKFPINGPMHQKITTKIPKKLKKTFDLITNTELNEGYHPSFLMNCAFVLFGYNNLGEGGAARSHRTWLQKICHGNKFVIPCLKVKITDKLGIWRNGSNVPFLQLKITPLSHCCVWYGGEIEGCVVCLLSFFLFFSSHYIGPRKCSDTKGCRD